jgi:branched-chain amino acid transport system ATP-binding protein
VTGAEGSEGPDAALPDADSSPVPDTDGPGATGAAVPDTDGPAATDAAVADTHGPGAAGAAVPDTDGPAVPGAAADPDGPAILELRNVTAAYGPFRALFGVSLSVGPGEAVALLGANGAGKTTVARVATGLVAPTSGSVAVEGEDFTGAGAFRFARAGVAHAPEGRSVFATLTVEENLSLSFRQSRGRDGVGSGLEQAFGMFPVLGERRRQLAGTLSGGEQRMLSMARVLVESPAVLVADELSLGLAPKIVDAVYESLTKLRENGSALLIVEQHVGHALDLCHRVLLLHHGAVTWEGPSDDAADRVLAELFEPAAP